MRLPALITTDLHLTANPRDDYRWGLWAWLRKECEKNNVQTLLILGDVTDAKDRHPAVLINRIVKEIDACRAVVPRIIINMGNHDYETTGNPFLGFLSTLSGVTFASRPSDTSSEGEAALFLPHTKAPLKDWGSFDWSMYRFVFMHQTVDGSIASNGQKMTGDVFPDMRAAGKIYSGDIHVPQIINGVEYIGSPYHVHFGDSFKPRCVLLDGFGKPRDLHFRTIQRRTIECLPGEFYVSGLPTLELRKGDQVKIRVHLQRSELQDWLEIKRQVIKSLKEAEVEVFGIELIVPKQRRRLKDDSALTAGTSDENVVLGFVEIEDIGAEALDVGLDLLS